MKRITRTVCLVVATNLGLAACGGGGGGSGDGPTAGTPSTPGVTCVDRGELCADELLSRSAAKLTDSRFYAAATGAVVAPHEFSGRLTVAPIRMRASGPEGSNRDTFPGFSVSFITVDDTLLPADRGIIFGTRGNHWDIILSPGKVWSETTDRGMSRASFPFTLVTKQWNEAHNGIATFLYDGTIVSRLRFQVSQETAIWNKLDFWGGTDASYEPGVVAGAGRLAQDFRDELAARVKVKPWSSLQSEYPDADLSTFTRGIAGRDVSGTAILVDDTLYYQKASTRAGTYPYPLEMRHGVFSVTKSAGAALTLLRLAEKYGEQVFDLFVTDYVEVTADHGGWNGVTFGHLLGMTAGVGDNFPTSSRLVTFADENDPNSFVWRDVWNTLPARSKLEHAFRYDDYPWAAGQIVRYNTAHTLILGAAMDGFYKAMEGPGADVWEMMEEDVFRPIGIPVIPMMKTTGEDAIPIWGFGLFLNAYDTARIAQLYQNDGAWHGQQLLHAGRTRQSLSRTLSTGLPTSVSVRLDGFTDQARYLNSFWSFIVRGTGGCTARIPYMWGFGGNFVMILPNGISAFRYADGDVHDPGALGLAAAAIRPAC